MSLPALRPAASRRQVVSSFDELVGRRFAEGVNAFCWERRLPGDYAEVVARLGGGMGVVPLEEERLEKLELSAAGRAASATMLADLHLLRDHGLDPLLNQIESYPRDENPGPVRTDVFSFHADSAPVEADTWLCTYYGAPSEGLSNEEARRRIDAPATRAALLSEFGGPEGEAFEDFLRDHCYDLHYEPLPHACPFSFGIGNLWRIACDYPGSPVPPCIHRAPDTGPNASARLLLIS